LDFGPISVSVRCPPPNGCVFGALVSTIDSGHLGALYGGARRYAMNANLIFKWLKDERYAPDADAVPEESEPVFLPVEVEVATSPVLALATAPAGRIEIELSSGHRITAEGGLMWMYWRGC